MTESAPPPMTAGSTLIFRSTANQRRAPAITALVFAVIASVLIITATARRDGWGGNFTVYAYVTGFVALVMLVLTVGGSRAVTECRPGTLHTRRFLTRDCAWSQITDIRQDSVSGRGGTAYFVVVITADGKQIKLGAPASASTPQNPLFASQLSQITAYWHAATGRSPRAPS